MLRQAHAGQAWLVFPPLLPLVLHISSIWLPPLGPSPRLLPRLLSCLCPHPHPSSRLLCRFSLPPPCLLPRRDRHSSEAKRCLHGYLPSTTQSLRIPLLTVSLSSPPPLLAPFIPRRVRPNPNCDRASESSVTAPFPAQNTHTTLRHIIERVMTSSSPLQAQETPSDAC